MELREPKRKRRCNLPQSQPLPVLIESVYGIVPCTSLWPVYTGTFSGDCVIITGQDEMSSLYNMGFFGKGCLSRGYPNFGKTKNGVPALVTKRQWKRRKLWMDHLQSFTNSTNLDNTRSDNKRDSSIFCKESNTCKKYINSNVVDDDLIEITSESGVPHSNAGNISNQGSTKDNSKPNDNTRQCHGRDKFLRKNLCDGSSSNAANNLTCPEETRSSPSNFKISSALSNESTCSFMPRSQDVTSNDYNENCVIVINDINSEDEGHPDSLTPHLCNEPIKTAAEALNLTLEEAFFLSFGIGCLQVVDLQGTFMSLQSMWRLYKEVQPNFIPSYITYHYFRSKGWIVKPGTKFGGDFLLYKEGPLFYHASYVVVIEEANNNLSNQNVKRQLTWTKVIGLNRIAETAAKEVLLSQVIWPSAIQVEDLNDPKIISKFKVQEVLLRRWNSGHERETKET